MGRKAMIEEGELMARLSAVFREVGYEGATLTMLSQAAGLKKASLYHRFPDGKEQMAREVLENAQSWLDEHVLSPLRGEGPPGERIARMVVQLDAYYSGGRQACLLNMLSSARIHGGPFTDVIKQIFQVWIESLSAAIADAGVEKQEAHARAERAVIMLQGSLVVSRGIGSTRPFHEFLKALPAELLREQGARELRHA